MRLERKMDLRTFATNVGMDSSTISRIENARMQVTLTSAAHICEGLGVPLSLFLESLQNRAWYSIASYPPSVDNVMPTLTDVLAFLRYVQNDWQGGYTFLAELLNTIDTLYISQAEERKRRVKHVYVLEDVEKLLSDSLLSHFELEYPPHIDAPDIWEIYQGGGLITVTDIGVYLKKIRQQMHVPLAQLQDVVKLSDSALSRIESGSWERIKLRDVLLLDEQLSQEGKVLTLYWHLYYCNEALSRFSQTVYPSEDEFASRQREQQMRLVSLFVTLCRWLYQSYGYEQTWMSTLRQKLYRHSSFEKSVESTEETSV